METRVISIRIPHSLATALEQSVVNARASVAQGVDWLVRNSLGNSWMLRGLEDCQEYCDVKVDARIPLSTLEPLKAAAGELRISLSVYVRRLLYHFYITKRLKYDTQNGRYTLAYRHD